MKLTVKEICEKNLKNKIKGKFPFKEYKKLKDGPMANENENFNKKDYFNSLTLREARIKFKLRSKMLDVKWNYKSDPNHAHNLWKCDSCQTNIETQNHILWCPAYADLRAGKDIKKDKDLVEYIKKVLIIRDNLNITK